MRTSLPKDPNVPFKADLFPGWNLISLPGTPALPAVADVLPPTLAVNAVLGYRGGEWASTIRTSDQWQGSLTEISGGYGYWIQTDAFESIEVAIPQARHEAKYHPDSPSQPVFGGWNLLGMFDIGQHTAGEPLDAHFGRMSTADHYFWGLNWRVAFSFDTQANAWEGVVRGQDKGNVIAVGKGYWVWAESPGDLSPREALTPETRGWMNDIIQSLDRINEYTEGKDLADYERETMVRRAVEREVTIIGEAVNRLHTAAPIRTHRINDYRAAIDLRNGLAHQYDREGLIPDIWHIIQVFLPIFRLEVEALLNAD